MGALRMPPYGREVAAALDTGRNVNCYLFAGNDCWKRAQRRREQHGQGSTLLLPFGDDPRDYRWPSVDALVCAVGDMERALVERLARALIRDGVRYACLIGDTDTVNAWASWNQQVAA